jgi:hypothetical protein
MSWTSQGFVVLTGITLFDVKNLQDAPQHDVVLVVAGLRHDSMIPNQAELALGLAALGAPLQHLVLLVDLVIAIVNFFANLATLVIFVLRTFLVRIEILERAREDVSRSRSIKPTLCATRVLTNEFRRDF